MSAYDGPYDDSPESPEGRVKTIQVMNVTPDSTKTEETDSDNDIPTIIGNFYSFIHCFVHRHFFVSLFTYLFVLCLFTYLFAHLFIHLVTHA